MTTMVHNIAKGRYAEWAERSRAGTDANGALILIPWASTGVDDSIKDADNVTALEAVANVAELASGGWNRKTISDGSITVTIDDTNNRVAVDIPDQTWTAVTTGTSTQVGSAWDNDTTAGTDTNILCGTWHDFAITPDGSDVTATVTDLYWAS